MEIREEARRRFFELQYLERAVLKAIEARQALEKTLLEGETISLTREELLACIVALERRRKLGEWEKSALAKILKRLGLKPRRKAGNGGNER